MNGWAYLKNFDGNRLFSSSTIDLTPHSIFMANGPIRAQWTPVVKDYKLIHEFKRIK